MRSPISTDPDQVAAAVRALEDDPRSDRMEALWARAHTQLQALIDATATARGMGRAMLCLGRGQVSDCADQACRRCVRCYAGSMQRLGAAKNDLEATSEQLVETIMDTEREAEAIRHGRRQDDR